MKTERVILLTAPLREAPQAPNKTITPRRLEVAWTNPALMGQSR